MRWMPRWLAGIAWLTAGVVLGGYLFSQSQPRSFLAVHRCQARCFKPNELAGLLTSVGVLKLGGALPGVVLETDYSIAVASPVKQAPVHYLIFPKRDLRDASDLTAQDREYLVDSFTVIGELVRRGQFTRWQVFTNGPAIQHLTYLHWHLLAWP